MIEVFGMRPNRFDLLKRGAETAGIREGDLVLEVGCGQGAGALYLVENFGCRVVGVDCNCQYIAAAQAVLNTKGRAGSSFVVGQAENLPLGSGHIDFIACEASFSLLTDKPRAVAEYRRVLRPGGSVIVNDFTISSGIDKDMREKMSFVPCFAGVQSTSVYKEIFEQAGFTTHVVKDEYKEVITTALWISRAYRCKPAELARIFAELLNGSKATCNADEASCKDFFRQARLGYAQLIFVKSEGGTHRTGAGSKSSQPRR